MLTYHLVCRSVKADLTYLTKNVFTDYAQGGRLSFLPVTSLYEEVDLRCSNFNTLQNNPVLFLIRARKG